MVRTELLGVGVPSGHPDLRLQMIRWTLMPGGTTDPHLRPGARVNYVEKGTWGVTVVEGAVELQPAGGDRALDRERLDIGVEYLLVPGDSLFIYEGAVIGSRSADEQPLVLWSSAISSAETPTTESIPAGSPDATPEG